MPVQNVLAYDLGGTKVAAGVVNPRGKVLKEIRVPVRIDQGKTAVIRQLADLGKDLLSSHPGIRRAGIASAGPLDPVKGVLLDPTNFAGPKGHWGQVPLARLLAAQLGLPVSVENDAAAAILAEHWVGAAKGYSNAMILTLGTGLGTGIIANGELVRAGRGLHPEAGHLILNSTDRSALCGCGNLGCAEAYLSGRAFVRRAVARFAGRELSAQEITGLARKGNTQAREAFAEYAWLMAVAIHNYTVIYCPEIVVFTGGFAEASDLFLPETRKHLEGLLARRRKGIDLLPKLKVSTLSNRAGLIGAAHLIFKEKRPDRSPRARG